MQHTTAPKRGLFFWALSPLLLIFVATMPFLIQKHDAAAISALAGVETAGVLMLLGLYDPHRFAWAWRGVGGIVFLAFVVYITAMLIEGKWQLPRGKGEANLWNAFGGLIAFGLPGLWWALFGKFPSAFASLDTRTAEDEHFDEFEPEDSDQSPDLR